MLKLLLRCTKRWGLDRMSKISKTVERLVAKANFSLREDVKRLLKSVLRKETNRKAKKALSWILENADLAKKYKLAICQDTGLPVVFIKVGPEVSLTAKVIKQIKEGLESGYKKNYLRPSMVDPLKRGKPTYKGFTYHIDFSGKRRELTLVIFPKGFGCENKSQLKMFNPMVSLDKIEDFIIKVVEDAGPEACPPFVVGVGIGGTSDKALLLAKKALIDKIDKPNPDKFLNALEGRLLKRINSLGIGPMGLGGRCSCLAVKIHTAQTHIAGLPVGVNISCHALRSAKIKLKV